MQILTKIFSFLEPRFLVENVSRVCNKFSCLLLDEAYWKIRVFKQWSAKYPPVTPSHPLDWLECAIEREEMVRRFDPRKNSIQSIVVSNTHYAACDTTSQNSKVGALMLGKVTKHEKVVKVSVCASPLVADPVCVVQLS